MAQPMTGIDPPTSTSACECCRRHPRSDADHPDSVALQRAVGNLFKKLKRRRRNETRDAVSEADRAVVAATATGSPDRIDDETAGIPLTSNTVGATAERSSGRARATSASSGTPRWTRSTTSCAPTARPPVTRSGTSAPI